MVGSQYFYSLPEDWQSGCRSKANLLNTGRDVAAEGEVGEGVAGGCKVTCEECLCMQLIKRVMACDFL